MCFLSYDDLFPGFSDTMAFEQLYIYGVARGKEASLWRFEQGAYNIGLS